MVAFLHPIRTFVMVMERPGCKCRLRGVSAYPGATGHRVAVWEFACSISLYGWLLPSSSKLGGIQGGGCALHTPSVASKPRDEEFSVAR